jgi:hypothetical protein
MQHQVHVLSVFDWISFKYWLFFPRTDLTQRQDNSVLLLQVIVLLNKESCFFILKYKSTVSHSPIEWAYYASGIGKPDLCCYCAAEGIQQDRKDTLSGSKFIQQI